MTQLAALDFELPSRNVRPLRTRLRAVLLGCGTVNSGVLDGLAEMSGAVEVSAVVTRRARPGKDGRTAWLTDIRDAFDTGPDLVIDGLPDCPAAEKALELAVERGIHVVSANKAVIARRPDLEATLEWVN